PGAYRRRGGHRQDDARTIAGGRGFGAGSTHPHRKLPRSGRDAALRTLGRAAGGAARGCFGAVAARLSWHYHPHQPGGGLHANARLPGRPRRPAAPRPAAGGSPLGRPRLARPAARPGALARYAARPAPGDVPPRGPDPPPPPLRAPARAGPRGPAAAPGPTP